MAVSAMRKLNLGNRLLRGWAFVLGGLVLLTGAQGGDILRGGAVNSGAKRNADARAAAGAEQAATANATARDRLARTSQAISAVQALQLKAKAGGMNGIIIPDGLASGGLKVLTGANARWDGASLPTQATVGSGVQVTVRQNEEQAVLHWETFNVSHNTELRFDQSAGGKDASKWIVFNKIFDPSGKPSQIFGSIKAEGQVYVLNQNGILFGAGSQVNVHALVASSLPINDNLVTSGLLNNPDLQFLFSALPIAAGAKGTPAFTPPAPLTLDGKVGDVIVEEGAELSAPTTADKVGGRIALIGANVRNSGSISTPDGQTILAAGLQVGMTAHPSADPSLRGLDVSVGSVGSYGGTVVNTGEISIPRASAMLTGKDVQQLGVIDGTTSVSLNGRVDLLANYNAVGNPAYDATIPANGGPFLAQTTGSVLLGAGSVTRIMPEVDSTEQAIGSILALRSQVNLQGNVIHLASGATILAPNAQVTAQAGTWAFTPSATLPRSQFIFSGGQIYVDGDAMIDVSGTTGVLAPLTQNILSVQLRGAELADSPLQRDQLLRAVMLTIDARNSGVYNGRSWIGTPLGDATGFLNLVERSVGQLTTAGGDVSLKAGDSVVLQKGSTVDVSGGWVKYTGGFVQTTKLLYQGRLVDIANATPDRIYQGIYTGQGTEVHTKWGVSKTYADPLSLMGGHMEEGYLSGADGGNLTINSASMALDGTLAGNTVAGPRQMRDTATLSEMAAPAELSLAFQAQSATGPSYFTTYPTPPQIIFQSGVAQQAVAPFAVDALGNALGLDASRKGTVYLSPDLLAKDGFGSLTINNSDGSILVPEDVTLTATAGGAITLTAANITVRGSVLAPGGSLAFKALNISPYAAAVAAASDTPIVPAANAGRGIFTLGANASLSTAGLIIDDRATGAEAGQSPYQITGGSIAISGYTVDLSKGSVVDVSGGVSMSPAGKKAYGSAGSIAIKAGQDPNLLSVLGGHLKLGAELLGYSGLAGGSLAVQAPLIQIGGSTTTADTLLLKPDFFNQGGFSSFALNGLGKPNGLVDGMYPGLLIAPGTVIDPNPQGAVALPFGNHGGLALVPMDLPVGSQRAVSLTFGAPGVRDSFTSAVVVRGDVVLGDGAVIRTRPTSSVSLTGDTVAVLGSIYAPAGSIAIKGAASSLPLFTDQTQALTTVYISPKSVLSAAGAVVSIPDAYGRHLGSVLPGGQISLAGNIVAAAGAVLDVSGASGTFDMNPAAVSPEESNLVSAQSGLTSPLWSLHTVPTQIDSNGGTISLKGGQMLFSDATLLGSAGGPTALGGVLLVSSGRFYTTGATPSPLDANLEVKQSGSVLAGGLPANATAIGRAVSGAGGISGRGSFSVDAFTRGGFDSLALGGVVDFKGPVSITARRGLSVADGGVLYADSTVQLTAPYVALGLAFATPVAAADLVSPFSGGTLFPPTFGPGSLVVKADLIDVGTLSLQNIGKASLIADNGDIRGDGFFDIAGDLTLRAGQVYPVTASPFTIVAYDHGGVSGSVTVQASGSRPLPLSAGGRLGIFASIITQDGTLRAPFGSITLGWDGTGTAPADLVTGSSAAFPVTKTLTLGAGSITSVSAVDPLTGIGLIIPYGISLDGNSWIDPAGTDISAIGAPQKNISLSATNLAVQSGATIDISGGGDLYAYRFVSGEGGSTDILASNGSYAVIPGYDSPYSPFGAFNSTTAATNLGGSPGYTNSTLAVGQKVYLNASPGLAAGTYTLLPARYALLPGAFLVTPQSGKLVGTVTKADQSTLVSGYMYNSLNASRDVPTLATKFEVASAAVVRTRARYDDYLASSALAALAPAGSTARLPQDAGHLILQATQTMTFGGMVNASGGPSGKGGLVDIASASDIRIIGSDGVAVPGTLALDSSSLSSFGADSLLIGGVRTVGSTGTVVSVKTGNITVDNAGDPLSAPDLTLVASKTLTLAPGAEVSGTGDPGALDTFLIGSATVAGSGNGVLLRVSGGVGGGIVRSGVSTSAIPSMTIGAGASLSGTSLTLDSTNATSLSPNANLAAQYINLNSGQISLQLDNPGALQPTVGLVLAGGALQDLQAATALSLLSYSSIDIYGTGSFTTLGSLALHAGQIRGFNAAGGTVTFNAPDILLDNASGLAAVGVVAPASGTLQFNADTLRIGLNQLSIDQYANLGLKATQGLSFTGSGGLKAQGNITVETPFVTAASQSVQSLVAGGLLSLTNPSGGGAGVASSLGANLTLQGASVVANSNIVLPSGLVTIAATAGDVTMNGLIDVSGTAQQFYDVTKYTPGGQVVIKSATGNVSLGSGSLVDVSADAGGGDAGTLTISSPLGSTTLGGSLFAQAGAGGNGGTFNLDVGTLPTTAALNSVLNAASFDYARNIRVRTGNVLIDGLAQSRTFNLSADKGSITVTGTIDSSGVTGGSIGLEARGNVTLASGSLLTVKGDTFSDAGKGGDVTLEAGSEINGVAGTGVVDIQTGSTIDLSVSSKIAGSASTPGTSAYYGDFSGKLHLRAPQNATFTDLLVNPINGNIIDPSSILVEGYRIYDLTASGGTITTAIQNSIAANAQSFLGAAGTTTAGYTAMMNRLLANNAGLSGVTVLAPGAEVINRTGDLTLGTTASTATSDWNLATYRYGAKRAPGVLTLRASGNLVFYNALSDGFTTAAYDSPLLTQSSLLPVNTQSWSYRLTAGADMTAASSGAVLPLTSLGASAGSIQIGKNDGTNVSNSNGTSNTPGTNATTSLAVSNRFQVIRTGSGDITLSSGRSIQLLNQFASVYTAGTKVADATMGGTFDLPILDETGGEVTLGAVQQQSPYDPQYTMAGGNVSLYAQANIEHLTKVGTALVADSQKELPNNWLYRRGYVDSTGNFGVGAFGDIASTTWWVDFSNFFEGIGALGGGNVTMVAGQNVSNVDAVIPTNARMPGRDSVGNPIAPDAANMVELGGGDLIVKTGQDLDAGVYYVERGQGTLNVGGSIKTNSTRSASLNSITTPATTLDPLTWLPTTLFVGQGGFDVSARGNVLLGPVANTFLLPEGINNTFQYKTYFSTYADDSYVDVSSLGGSVTLRESATFPTSGGGVTTPLLLAYIQRVQLFTTNPASTSFYQPWLRLDENSVAPFRTTVSVMPSTLSATAFGGDIDLDGNITLSPSASGSVDLLAAGSINGLQPNGLVTLPSGKVTSWGTATINVSDADPDSIPGIEDPFAYQSVVGTTVAKARATGTGFLTFIDNLFLETGSPNGVLQTKEALHDAGLLHKNDTDPLRLYTLTGDISGLKLFSPKEAQVIAGRDLTDVSLYLQNLSATDLSVVSSGRDMILYDASTPLRVAATQTGNIINLDGGPEAGDIQIAGPGTLEVLAGRNLDMGSGPNRADGTGVGITSIGNLRNPYLGGTGSQLIVGAGLGLMPGLSGGNLGVDAFLAQYGEKYSGEIAADLNGGTLDSLSPEARAEEAVKILYLVLRDSGRQFATLGDAAYADGFSAIQTLFGDKAAKGDILLRSRDLRTRQGGDIDVLAPGGKLTLADSNVTSTLAPPGIITESGGNIGIFTAGDVSLGVGRIFTLRGGNEIIWSSTGDIAAGSSAKTVTFAPPTRVVIDPQSADVQNDLAGLATGGGIGVLATVTGVKPGDVDLIAPVGTVDAGDAGIRVSGNLNIAATAVLNASNIAAAGTSTGVPSTPTVAAPNIAGLTSASSATGATSNMADQVANQARQQGQDNNDAPSIISVDVLGYGGDDSDDTDNGHSASL